MNDSAIKRIAVIGFGVTGRSCVDWFVKNGYEVSVFDTRPHVNGIEEFASAYPDVEVQLGQLDATILSQFDRVIVSPGISIKSSVFQNLFDAGVDVLGDVQVFAEQNQKPIIAITGSNGKSTVTMLVGTMLKAAGRNVAIAGNIGTPVLDVLDDEQYDAFVLELSSFQLETTTSLNPAVAVVLNVSPDHMDRYDSVDEYADAKAKVYTNAKFSVVNRDDPIVAKMQTDGKAIGFTLSEPKAGDYGMRQRGGETFLCKGDHELISTQELPIAGSHNCANVLAAMALCEGLGVDPTHTLDAIRNFNGLDHRTQLIATSNGISWFDDSKGTNVGATIAAVDGMQGPVVLLAGGQAKGQDFHPLRDVVKRNAKAVILFGEDADLIEAAISGVKPIYRVADMNEAVHRAKEISEPGDNVLLSPACASFDMFDNYVARGKAFVKAVEIMLDHE